MITLAEIIERDKRPPSVTVCMTCYNHEKYLDEAIQGVLKQKTNFPVTILIHDDASPDGSAEIIKRYASENPNIIALFEETNCILNGKSFFHKMLPHMTGKYIAYCECDDFWIDENKLQIQVDYLENNPDCISVYSNIVPVNKYSQYDESVRGGYTKYAEEGDYPPDYLFGVRHQLASCVFRNFYRLMSSEDLNFFREVIANGDEKILSLCLRLGRVHYFKQEFAAHRRVLDEGSSYTARMARKSEYEKHCFFLRQLTELYRMNEHFFGKRYPQIYLQVLREEVRNLRRNHRSIIKDAQLHSCYHLKNIPLHVYINFLSYASYRMAVKILKIILPEKVLTSLKKLSKIRCSLFAVRCSLM